MRQIKLFLLVYLACFSWTTARADGWPAKYNGVMLQGFYWDSYADTAWPELERQADELSEWFSLVWVPQSGYCNTMTNQMGYMPVWWFRHDSAFGSEAELRSMIAAFASKGVGVIEDVVINHRAGNTNWCDFPTETWNGHTCSWTLADICTGDDGGKTQAAGYNVSGATDTGDDFDGGRDLDHTSTNVQQNITIYLDFLLHDLGYAGFRYDMVKGYAPRFTGQYNAGAKPQFSVGEYWDNYANIKTWIDGTKIDGQIQSAAFDFPQRYNITDAFGGGQWSKLDGQCLSRNSLYSRYGVGFIDNHDTYRNEALKKNIEAANAYLLMMPGTPCVFLRHWQMYQTAIKRLIFVRRAVGIHNESLVVSGQAASDGYTLTVAGDNGRALLAIGNTSAQTAGYKLAINGDGYKLYVSQDIDLAGLEDIIEPENTWTAPEGCTVSDNELCAFFEAPPSWTTVKCWAWNASTNFTGGTWPGVACTPVATAENGRQIWKWNGGTINTGSRPTGIIFNNGTQQTADLDFTNGGYYTLNGLQGTVPTAIRDVRADKRGGRAYRLDGTRVPEGTKPNGVYIENAKKYLRR